MAKQQVIVSVLADTKKFSRAMKNLGNETGLNQFAAKVKSASKVITAGVAVAGAGAVAIATKATGAASQLEQSMGGVDAVFKQNAKQIHSWATGASSALGLSKNQYNEFATVVGSQLKNMGVAQDQVTGQTNDLIKMGADLAAQFGGSTSDAVSALSALMRGEADPIERYGVSIKEADIKAQMLADGTSKLTGEQGKLAKAQAQLTLLNKQTADSQGAFGRETNTLAGQQERLKAKFENITATLGQYFLPAATKVTEWFSNNLEPALENATNWINTKVIPLFQRLGDWFTENKPALEQFSAKVQEIATNAFAVLVAVGAQVVAFLMNAAIWIKDNVNWLGPLAAMLLTAVASYQAYIKTMAIWKAVTIAADAAQKMLNISMLANPIGLVVAAVAALVAGLALFFTKTETGRKIWDTVWTAIQDGFQAFIDWVKPILDDLGSAWKVQWERVKAVWEEIGPPIMAAIKVALGALKTYWAMVFNAIKTVVVTVFRNVQTIIQTVMGVISGVIKTVTSVIKGDWSGAWEGMKQIFSSIWNGFKGIVENAFKGVLDFVKGIPDKIKGAIPNPLGVLEGIGTSLISGLTNGLEAAYDGVKRSLNWLTSKLGDWKGPASKDKKLLEPAGKKIIAGFLKGLKSGYSNVKKSLTDFTKELQALGSKQAAKLSKAQGKKSGLTTTYVTDLLTTSSAAFSKKSARAKRLADANREKVTLKDVALAQDRVTASLEKQRAKLSELTKARAALKNQVAESIRGELDLGQALSPTTNATGHTTGGGATFKGVAGTVKSLAKRAKTFALKLKALVKKGIPAGLVQEVAAMGTDEGTKVATALLSGTSAQVKELTADYKSMNAWSAKAGSYVADQMYKSGINAQLGLIKGLESDSKKLEKAAEKIAKKLVRAVNKELGIASPAKEFIKTGKWSMKGLQAGLEQNYRPVESSLTKFTGGLANTPIELKKALPVASTSTQSGVAGRNFTDADLMALADVLAGRPLNVNVDASLSMSGRQAATFYLGSVDAARKLGASV